MRWVRNFLQFWYSFIVGDDWRIAAGAILALSVAFALSLAGINAWLIFPLLIVVGFLVSIRRAIRVTKHNEKHQDHIISLLRSWFKLWGPLVMVAVLPILASYLKNTSETSVQDLILPAVLNILAVTIIAAIFFKPFLKARFTFYLTAVLTAIVVSNGYAGKSGSAYSLISGILPFTLSPLVFGVIYLVVVFYLLYLVAKWINDFATRRNWRTDEIMLAATIAIAATFLLQFIPTTVDLAEAWPQFFYQPAKLPAATPTSAQVANKPDIYYIVLEDYGSQQVLSNQMSFDNSNFLQYLSNKGFYNAPNASSNYPYTVNSVASTLNGNYMSDAINKFSSSLNQTMIPYFQTARLSPVIQQLKSYGYKYDLLGDWYETSSFSSLADHTDTNDDEIVALGHTYDLDDFADLQVQQNFFWPIIQAGLTFGHYKILGYNTQSTTDQIQSQLTQLTALSNQPGGGRFIFSQILVPHNYFYYNADGSLNTNPNPDNTGELVQQKDTNEIQYINSQIEPIISNIMTKSHGKAAIILQSDEGPDPLVMNHADSTNSDTYQKNLGNMLNWSSTDLQMKFGVLASYYIPGASASDLSEAANPVNVFRLVLNQYLNNNLSYLPLCYYGFPQGLDESFVYHGVTKAITGQSNSSCPQNGNFIKPGPTKLVKSKAQHTNSGESGDD